jgi:hypothetical protein
MVFLDLLLKTKEPAVVHGFTELRARQVLWKRGGLQPLQIAPGWAALATGLA